MTLEDHLHLFARRCPDKAALVCGGQTLTYAQLWQAASERAQALGDRRGRVVPLRATRDVRFFTDYFAIHLAGGAAAPLDSGCPETAFARLSDTLRVSTVPADTADVLCTTGSTGTPKGVIISHRAIVANAENLIEAQGYAHALTFVINGPLNHIGSLSKLWPTIMVGGTVRVVEGLKDPNAFLAAMAEAEGRTATFLVPAHIRMLLTLCAERLRSLADQIDFIETGAAPIARDDMLALCRLLPKARLFNTYASTETGIIATYNYNDGACLAGCLGRPMRHSRITITLDGRIACHGATLMTGYIGDEPPASDILRNGTLLTADLGRLDEQGRLHLLGREDDVINVGGFKVSPVEVEDAALSHPGVADCICIAQPHPLTGSALKLLVVTAGTMPLDRRQLAQWLAVRLEPHKVPLLYQQTDQIERTFNGKPNRRAYR